MRIEQLEVELMLIDPPKEVQLTKWERITDVPKFIDAHLCILKRHSGNPTFQPYYDRLLLLYKILTHAGTEDTGKANQAT